MADGRIPPRGEARIDVIAASRSVVQVGGGVDLPVSRYARLEAVLAAGPRLGAGGPEFSARADALVRFVLDPLVRLARSPYGGAGISLRHASGSTTPALVALLGLQLRTRGGYAPAVELGIGSGARLGIVVRRSP